MLWFVTIRAYASLSLSYARKVTEYFIARKLFSRFFCFFSRQWADIVIANAVSGRRFHCD